MEIPTITVKIRIAAKWADVKMGFLLFFSVFRSSVQVLLSLPIRDYS